MDERAIVGRRLRVRCVNIVRQGKSKDVAPDVLELQRLTEDRNGKPVTRSPSYISALATFMCDDSTYLTTVLTRLRRFLRS